MNTSIPDFITRWQFYFTQDPVGQKILLGALIVLALVGLFVAVKSMRWAAARWKEIFGFALVLAALFFAATWVLNFGLLGIVVAGVMCLGMLIGFALFMTHA